MDSSPMNSHKKNTESNIQSSENQICYHKNVSMSEKESSPMYSYRKSIERSRSRDRINKYDKKESENDVSYIKNLHRCELIQTIERRMINRLL